MTRQGDGFHRASEVQLEGSRKNMCEAEKGWKSREGVTRKKRRGEYWAPLLTAEGRGEVPGMKSSGAVSRKRREGKS